MWMLIDGNNWFHMAWHSIGPDCQDFILLKIRLMVEKHKFDRVVVAFDGGRSWRKESVAEYKSKRPEKPEGFEESFSKLKSMVREKYEVMEVDGYEADDLIGSLARDAVDEGVKAVICSSDKDMHQCLVDGFVSQCKKIKIFADRVDYCTWMTAKDLHETYGVHPYQWVDFRAITGDPSDCLPGCAGLGESAAKKILRSWRTLEEFKEDPDRIKLGPMTRQKLLDFIDDPSGLKMHRRLMKLGEMQVRYAAQASR